MNACVREDKDVNVIDMDVPVSYRHLLQNQKNFRKKKMNGILCRCLLVSKYYLQF